jgi:Tripartite tricarboxylate transporter TctB family
MQQDFTPTDGHMKIKSEKDFYSGLMFFALGIAFAVGAVGYNVRGGDKGEHGDYHPAIQWVYDLALGGSQMGPGYFPLMLGIILAVLGAAITFFSLTVETADGDKVGGWAWKPLLCILGANLVFGACGRALQMGRGALAGHGAGRGLLRRFHQVAEIAAARVACLHRLI